MEKAVFKNRVNSSWDGMKINVQITLAEKGHQRKKPEVYINVHSRMFLHSTDT